MALTVAAVLPSHQQHEQQHHKQQQQQQSSNKARSIMSLLSRLGSTASTAANNSNNNFEEDDEIESGTLEWDDIACQFELNDEQEEEEEDEGEDHEKAETEAEEDRKEFGAASNAAGVAKALKDARNRQKMSVFKKEQEKKTYFRRILCGQSRPWIFIFLFYSPLRFYGGEGRVE